MNLHREYAFFVPRHIWGYNPEMACEVTVVILHGVVCILVSCYGVKFSACTHRHTLHPGNFDPIIDRLKKFHRCLAVWDPFPWQGGSHVPWFLHFEPSLDALSSRSDVIGSMKFLSSQGAFRDVREDPVLRCCSGKAYPALLRSCIAQVPAYLDHEKLQPPRTLQ